MELYMMVNGIKEEKKDMAFKNHQMEQSTQVNGKMISDMGKVLKHYKMELTLKLHGNLD